MQEIEDDSVYRINGIMNTLEQIEDASVFVELIRKANYHRFLNDKNANVTLFLSLNNFFQIVLFLPIWK